MGRFVYYTASTLDGFLADEHDSLDWLFRQEIDPSGPGGYESFIERVGAVVMGATTYTWILEHLDTVGDELDLSSPGWPYQQPTFVFTHRNLPLPTGDVRIVRGEPDGHRSALLEAAAGQDVWIVGGGDLAGQFAEADMLDRVEVSFAPVALGAGRPLFPRRMDLRLDRVERNGDFACVAYDVAGPLAEDAPDPRSA